MGRIADKPPAPQPVLEADVGCNLPAPGALRLILPARAYVKASETICGRPPDPTVEPHMTDPRAPTTIFFDGSCPLCRAEIGLYARQDASGALRLVDVSAPDACMPPGLDRGQAMARFHVMDADGRLMSGARAFGAVWRRLPRWRWAGRVAQWRPAEVVLEIGYWAFLKLRPALVRAFVVVSRGGSHVDAAR